MKKLIINSAIVGAITGLVFVSLQKYVKKALWYGGPDVDDYKIFYNRVIEAGKHIPWRKHSNYNKFVIPKKRRDIIESYNPIAALVIQNEKIIYEEYWDGYTKDSVSNSFSAAKSIVSLLIGIALDEGKIASLDQKIGDFIKAYSTGSKSELTIRQVLTMSSGLNWKETYVTPFSTTAKAYYGSDLDSLISGLDVVEKPGVEFEYLSGNTQLLAMVVQAATGKHISDFTSEKIWKHIGAQHDALWNLDGKNGMEKAYCCFNTNVRDFARFGQLILNKGKWNGKRIISKKYVKEATSPKKYLKDKLTGDTVDFYGFQWWIITYNGMQIPYMRGILGQYIFVIPDKNAVVVRLGHNRSKEIINHHPKDVYDYLEDAFLLLK
jgi:CubicO group peptidase (beta-lactamase class C family)